MIPDNISNISYQKVYKTNVSFNKFILCNSLAVYFMTYYIMTAMHHSTQFNTTQLFQIFTLTNTNDTDNKATSFSS